MQSLASPNSTGERARVNIESPSSLVQVPAPAPRQFALAGNLMLVLGCVALAAPTMYEVATKTWTTEQGGHGPLVFVTGLWAIWREVRGKDIVRRPGKLAIGLPLLALPLAVFV